MGKRPDHVKPPKYLSKNTPVPKPDKVEFKPRIEGKMEHDPVRYGDWEHGGIAWDF